MRRLERWFPILGWLPTYRGAWLRLDAVAGTTLAAYAVPNAVAYALLAGLPPAAGLAGYLFGGLVYAVLGTSRQLAFGPTSAISLVVATTLAPLAGSHPEHYAALAALTALLVGALALASWAMRWGGIAHFISSPTLVGYRFGAALVIALSQVPDLLGLPPVAGSNALGRLVDVLAHLGQARLPVLVVGLSALLLLEIGQRLLPRWPVGLGVVLASMGAAVFAGLGERGVPLVGALPQGLPRLGLPAVGLADLRPLLTLAVACFLLAYLEGMATARTLAVESGDRVDANQELLALGAANVALGLAQGYPAGGGLGQSAVNAQAGARSPLALVFTSGWMAILLLFVVGAFRYLPRATLAALVIASVTSLLSLRELLRLGRASRTAQAVMVATIAGVLYLGILQGVLVAALLSLVLILRDEASLPLSELGRAEGAEPFVDVARHPAARRLPGVLILRVNGPLLYFNAEAVEAQVLARAESAEAGLRRVVLDLSFSAALDVSVADMLRRLKAGLRHRGVELSLAEVHHRARAELVRQRLGALLVDAGERLPVAETLALCERRT